MPAQIEVEPSGLSQQLAVVRRSEMLAGRNEPLAELREAEAVA